MAEPKLADLTPEERVKYAVGLAGGKIGVTYYASRMAALRDADRAAEQDIWVAKMEAAVRKAWANATESTALKIAEYLDARAVAARETGRRAPLPTLHVVAAEAYEMAASVARAGADDAR